MHIGFIVNPIAGMGGRVGLKGTDGKVTEARDRGAEPRAPDRAREAMESIARHAPETKITTAPGELGATPAKAAGFEPTVVTAIDPGRTNAPAATSAEDTIAAVEAMVDADVELVVFVGGDGTATDVATTLDRLTVETPMLGVPAGVKVYSSVFAVTPAETGRLIAGFDRVERREVNDIDETAYRSGTVETQLQAVRPVPVGEGLQASKQLGGGSVEGIAAGVAAETVPGHTYVLGPGGTLQQIKAKLGFEGTPLGVDVWRAADDGGELLVADAAEADILEALGTDNHIIVSPIGGQGFVFGRGNDQISPAVIDRSTVEIVASRSKLDDLDVLRVDIDDPEITSQVTGWQKVRIGRVQRRMVKVV